MDEGLEAEGVHSAEAFGGEAMGEEGEAVAGEGVGLGVRVGVVVAVDIKCTFLSGWCGCCAFRVAAVRGSVCLPRGGGAGWFGKNGRQERVMGIIQRGIYMCVYVNW